MSVAALLTAVESRLRSAAVLNDPNGEISGAQEDGRPPPFAGQWYYAVWWPGSRQTDANPLSLDVEHAVTVTITARMGYVPKDRRGAYLKATGELEQRAEAVAVAVHAEYAGVTVAANALIPGTAEWAAAQLPPVSPTKNGFVEPLRFLDYGPVKKQSAEWVGAKPESNAAVYTIDVRFGGARRVQYIGG